MGRWECDSEKNFITLKLWATISCIDTALMITAINDTHQLVWKLFGEQNIGQTVSLHSFWGRWK